VSVFEYRPAPAIHPCWRLERDSTVEIEATDRLGEVEDAIDEAIAAHCSTHSNCDHPCARPGLASCHNLRRLGHGLPLDANRT
jgi:hypothetical protein